MIELVNKDNVKIGDTVRLARDVSCGNLFIPKGTVTKVTNTLIHIVGLECGVGVDYRAIELPLAIKANGDCIWP